MLAILPGLMHNLNNAGSLPGANAMDDDLITVGQFAEVYEANLAKNRLESAGITAVISDDATVDMAWQLTNAIGGVRLQVRRTDADQANEILADPIPLEEVEAAAKESLPADEPDEEPDFPLNHREQNADRAFRSAVIGILFWPIQFYTLWLMLQVWFSNEPLRPKFRWRAWAATAIHLPFLILMWFALQFLYGG